MKQLSKQTSKWALSALLFAALGSQYYFSSYSNHQGSAEMASEGESTATTEARTVLCDICGTNGITFSGPNSLADTEKFLAGLKALKDNKAASTRVVVSGTPPAKIETEEEKAARIKKEKEAQIVADCKYKDTVAERARCEREARADARKEEKEAKDEAKRLAKEEKDAKKKEIADAKAEKLKEAKEKRNEEFAEKADSIAADCKDSDLSCFTDRFTSLLSEYSGTKKVDAFAINKAYTKYIEKDLKAGLRGSPESRQQALAVIESITGQELPREYRAVKEKTIDALKAATISRGVEVNNNFKLADQMLKAGRPNEYLQYMNAGLVQKEEFIADSNIYGQTVVQSLNQAKDATSLDYFNTNFMPDVRKLMANLQNVNGIDLSKLGSGNTTSTTINPIGTTGSRGGRSGNVSSSTVNGNITNGVDFGTASKTSTSTKRGGK